MRYRIVPVKNVARLQEAAAALLARSPGMPGMGLVYGPTGYGKTVSTDFLVNQVNGVFVRALALTTPSSLLGSIARELNMRPRGSCAAMVEAIVEQLAATRRPLFIDEADYLVEKKRTVETLRDLHDLSDVPVILIGEEDVDRKLASLKRLTRRLAQAVRFAPCDMADARLLADGLAEVRVADDLLERLHLEANGSAGLIVVGLAHIEAFAKSRGMELVEATDWKGDFFVGRAPSPTPPASGGGGGKVTRLRRRR